MMLGRSARRLRPRRAIIDCAPTPKSRRHSGQRDHPRHRRGTGNRRRGLSHRRFHARHGAAIVSCSIFSGALVLVYLCSTLYHSLVRTRARHVFHILDHASIYLLIAGTYTPFTLVSLRGPLGWTLFAVVWALAVAGVVFKSFAVDRFAVAVRRWFICSRAGSWSLRAPLSQAIGSHGMVWLFAGGLAYTPASSFCLRPPALLPRRLAHLCPGRQRRALLRDPFLRVAGAALTLPTRAAMIRFREALPCRSRVALILPASRGATRGNRIELHA